MRYDSSQGGSTMKIKLWVRKFMLKLLLGIGGMIFGALFMVIWLLIFTIEVVFQGMEIIFANLN